MGISVFGRDITALKAAEEERDVIRLQLLQAQKMDSLGSLVGGVAHDFNNMLGGIMGYADLLLAGETHPMRREQLQAILRAAGRSSDLTRKLLAFARRGKNIVEAVDLNATIRESLARLGPSMGSRVELRLQLDARHGIDGDPTQLNQLVVNLCLNAHEAMPNGGVLAVSTRDLTDGDPAAPPRLDHVGTAGISHVAAADGAEGVDLFRRHHHELSGVLLDLKMPRMGGRAAFEQMHAIAPAVPVLLCSRYGENEEAQSLTSAGAAGLLSKPCRVADLAEHVVQLRR